MYMYEHVYLYDNYLHVHVAGIYNTCTRYLLVLSMYDGFRDSSDQFYQIIDNKQYIHVHVYVHMYPFNCFVVSSMNCGFLVSETQQQNLTIHVVTYYIQSLQVAFFLLFYRLYQSFKAWAKLAQKWLVCVPLGIHLDPINKELMLLVTI